MDNAILPICYFPPISYFVYQNQYDITLEKKEYYIKQTYRNRFNILSANGIQKLSIPIVHNGQRAIDKIEISYTEDWQHLHYKALKYNYLSSPFYEYYEEKIKAIFNQKFIYLLDLNIYILKIINTILQLPTDYKFTNAYHKEYKGIDLRTQFSPKTEKNLIFEHYYQVFTDRFGFFSNLSILDLIFNLGPEAKTYINNNKIT